MDCQAARLLFWFKRPQANELLAEDEAALARHLAACESCARLHRVLAQEDRLLGRAVRAVSVPPSLKGQLLARLQTEGVKLKLAERGRLFRLGLGLALAALLVAAGVAWWANQPPPPVSLRELAIWGHDRFSLPTQAPTEAKLQWLEHYFYSNSVWARLPASFVRQWDFTHLSAAYVEEFSHGRTAILEFKKPGGHAIVFLLPAARCRSAELGQYQGANEAGRLWPTQGGDEFVAFFVLKEGTLEQFLLPMK